MVTAQVLSRDGVEVDVEQLRSIVQRYVPPVKYVAMAVHTTGFVAKKHPILAVSFRVSGSEHPPLSVLINWSEYDNNANIWDAGYATADKVWDDFIKQRDSYLESGKLFGYTRDAIQNGGMTPVEAAHVLYDFLEEWTQDASLLDARNKMTIVGHDVKFWMPFLTQHMRLLPEPVVLPSFEVYDTAIPHRAVAANVAWPSYMTPEAFVTAVNETRSRVVTNIDTMCRQLYNLGDKPSAPTASEENVILTERLLNYYRNLAAC